MHMLMCIVMSIVIVCLHNVSMIPIGVQGAYQEKEELSHHHVVQETSIPHEPSQLFLTFLHFILRMKDNITLAGRQEML
jgi:hypothetical protein